MQFDNSHIQGIPRSKIIIAIVDPHHDSMYVDYVFVNMHALSRVSHQCSTRAVQNIAGHHRPVID